MDNCRCWQNSVVVTIERKPLNVYRYYFDRVSKALSFRAPFWRQFKFQPVSYFQRKLVWMLCHPCHIHFVFFNLVQSVITIWWTFGFVTWGQESKNSYGNISSKNMQLCYGNSFVKGKAGDNFQHACLNKPENSRILPKHVGWIWPLC
jgi:hypothetical protein